MAPASGVAPAPYSASDSVLTVDISSGVLANPVPGLDPLVTVADVQTGLVTSTATSNVDGLSGSRTATGEHVINGLDLSIVETLGVADLLSISATTLEVSSEVSGDYGGLGSVGSLYVEDLIISVAGIAIPGYGGLGVTGFIAANTGVALTGPLLGTSLILNQQIVTGDGINSLSLTTNAISLDVSAINIDLVGALTGTVTVGPTSASLQASAVPEPSSAILLSLVCAGGVWVRRRVKQKTALTLAS